jgi:hypothetical protein
MKCVISPKEKATTKMYHVACPMGRPTSKSECVEIQTSNDPYPGPVFFKKKICWALPPQGQGLLRWIQLLEVLPY